MWQILPSSSNDTNACGEPLFRNPWLFAAKGTPWRRRSSKHCRPGSTVSTITKSGTSLEYKRPPGSEEDVRKISKRFYWLQMSGEVAETVRTVINSPIIGYSYGRARTIFICSRIGSHFRLWGYISYGDLPKQERTDIYYNHHRNIPKYGAGYSVPTNRRLKGKKGLRGELVF